MPFQIVRNDITAMAVDAIVNTANPRPIVGPGVDSAIHDKAGPRLLQARQKIGSIPRGQAAITKGYDLPAKYVIHTVGPVWTGGDQNEDALLRSCYDTSMSLALKHRCRSIAFPLISTGTYGFPRDRALQIAISAFSAFMQEYDIDIYLVVYDCASFQLSQNLFQNVASYIDERYITIHAFTRGLWGKRDRTAPHRSMELCESARPEPDAPVAAALEKAQPCTASPKKASSLTEMLQQADAGFTETLLKLIDKTGKKDSEIYKKANLSKQHFSKIRNNPHYKPTKTTAIALALALELNLDETRDLIGRAGYALTNSSKFDLIIRYFIEQGNYNVVEINIALYEFDQALIGG